MILSVLSGLAIVLLRKWELVSLQLLCCVVVVCVLCLFLTVPWAGLQSVIVAFPGHTHLLFTRTHTLFILIYASIAIVRNNLLYTLLNCFICLHRWYFNIY